MFIPNLYNLLKGLYNSVGADGIYRMPSQFLKKEKLWKRKYFSHLKAMAKSLGSTRQRVMLASLQLLQHQLPLLVKTELINDAFQIYVFYYTKHWKLTYTLPWSPIKQSQKQKFGHIRQQSSMSNEIYNKHSTCLTANNNILLLTCLQARNHVQHVDQTNGHSIHMALNINR